MTRLTEIVLSKSTGKGQDLRKARILLPPVLRDKIIAVKEKPKHSGCHNEMMAMVKCWKENNFENSTCAAEMLSFQKCLSAKETAKKAMDTATAGDSKREVNSLLKMYHQPPHEVKLTTGNFKPLRRKKED